MLKLRKRKSKVEARGGANTSGIIHGATASQHRSFTPVWWREIGSRKRAIIVVLVVVALSTVGYTIGEWVKYDRESKIPSRMIPTEQEYLSSHLGELLAHPPASSAPQNVRTDYYDDLTLTYADQKQFAKAIQSFKTREAISTEGIQYHNYLDQAGYESRVGNASGALLALDKAEALLPVADDPTGYSRDETLEYIAGLRKEYGR